MPGAAVLDRLGVDRVKTGHQLKSLRGGTDSMSTEPVVAVYESGEEYEVDGVIGADGLHSVVRREFYTGEAPHNIGAAINPSSPAGSAGADKPKFTGWVCWRGATLMPPVWDKRTMVIQGKIQDTASGEVLSGKHSGRRGLKQ